MKQLEELQKKVLQVIQRNKELSEENKYLSIDNEKLNEKCKQLESSLLGRSQNFESLKNEKDEIKSCLDDLIDSIGSLEKADKEISK